MHPAPWKDLEVSKCNERNQNIHLLGPISTHTYRYADICLPQFQTVQLDIFALQNRVTVGDGLVTSREQQI